jgi:hypothetical protein
MPHAGHDSSPWLPGHLGPGLALPVVGWALAGYLLVSAVVLFAHVGRARLANPTASPAPPHLPTHPPAPEPAAPPTGTTRPAPAPLQLVPPILLTPRIAAVCEATMALGNGYLLLAMLS